MTQIGILSNCFSINRLVGQNIILKKRTETSEKRQFSQLFSMNKSIPCVTSGLLPMDSE